MLLKQPWQHCSGVSFRPSPDPCWAQTMTLASSDLGIYQRVLSLCSFCRTDGLFMANQALGGMKNLPTNVNRTQALSLSCFTIDFTDSLRYSIKQEISVFQYWVRCPMRSKYPWTVTIIILWHSLLSFVTSMVNCSTQQRNRRSNPVCSTIFFVKRAISSPNFQFCKSSVST